MDEQPNHDGREEAHEGWQPDLGTEEDLFHAVEQAFDYRGNVTVTTREGERVEGYVFDRTRANRPEKSEFRIIPGGSDTSNRTFSYADVKRIEFTGEDATEKNPWPPDGEDA